MTIPKEELKATTKDKPKRKPRKKNKLKGKSTNYHNSPAITLKYSDRRHTLFMDKLKETSNVTVAAKAAGVIRATVYRWRDQVSGFASEWDDILAGRMEELECEVYDRAKEGLLEDVYHNGQVVGTKRKPSDQLAMFLLKANKPNVYDRSNSITIEGEGEFTMTINDQQRDIKE